MAYYLHATGQHVSVGTGAVQMSKIGDTSHDARRQKQEITTCCKNAIFILKGPRRNRQSINYYYATGFVALLNVQCTYKAQKFLS
ncbi:hypothetical protein FOIG_11428 [Fusarium odoratissimum NRRL 54006]|uniref:Uncharacterized protein n=2 Tax=Fusarium oxysporum species complex TaxID=171631 RepID=X0J5R2_FUSO5|nr:uncharacterized protein FOIG_11428 [Fusarium odoratissimum NRRL 54006]EXL96477.1 hypothetical protein FOIG_11428 [Fusarium odoratissimum NRRL 54006]TXB99730.1 hypothetical protein FocTR4_00013826 [Fusarium oxysporum f. sp. cubense]